MTTPKLKDSVIEDHLANYDAKHKQKRNTASQFHYGLNLSSEPDAFRFNCIKATKSDFVKLKLVAVFFDEERSDAGVTTKEIASEQI